MNLDWCVSSSCLVGPFVIVISRPSAASSPYFTISLDLFNPKDQQGPSNGRVSLNLYRIASFEGSGYLGCNLSTCHGRQAVLGPRQFYQTTTRRYALRIYPPHRMQSVVVTDRHPESGQVPRMSQGILPNIWSMELKYLSCTCTKFIPSKCGLGGGFKCFLFMFTLYLGGNDQI